MKKWSEKFLKKHFTNEKIYVILDSEIRMILILRSEATYATGNKEA
jgi:hypothetical protein